MPLINPRLIKNQLPKKDIPASHLEILQAWQGSITNRAIFKQKETALHSHFIQKILIEVLGYQGFGGDTWTLAQEQKIGAGSVDVALGSFSSDSAHTLAPFELKGAKTKDLDAIMPGRHKSPVQQAWEYAMDAAGAQWVLVSNYLEIRLYAVGYGRQFYESWDLSRLTEPQEYARLQWLLSAEQLLSGQTRKILERSEQLEKEITNQLYKEYKTLRENLFDNLKQNNSTIDPLELIRLTQKIIDRILFVAFAEDCGLLPEKTIDRAFQHNDPYNPRPLWENFKGVFRAIDQGNATLKIPAYNGGLFAADAVLDSLIVDDTICQAFKELGEYDFASEVSVTVLGHIFEQSISDIEGLQAQVKGDIASDKKVSKRKKDGIFYTPAYITRYIVEQAVGGWLNDRKQEIGFNDLPELTEQDYESIKPITRGKRKGQVDYNDKIARHIQAWEAYKAVLSNIKVLDPACGSGAFLNEVFDYLYREGQVVNNQLADLNAGQAHLFRWDTHILSNNLYGVDINHESVEISKLSLWLKTANPREKLTYLEDNIKCGNSLIDDVDVAGDKAFDWNKEFAEIMESGGFDVVVGNPPYLRLQGLRDAHNKESIYYEKIYTSATANYDIYVCFIEKSHNIIKLNGNVGFILPHKWLISEFGVGIRQYLSKKKAVQKIIHFGENLIFPGVSTYTCCLFLSGYANEFVEFLHTFPNTLFESSKKLSKIYYDNLTKEKWNLTYSNLSNILLKIKKQPYTIKDIFSRIFVGLQTSADKIYILKGIEQDGYVYGYSASLNIDVKIESGLTKRFIKPEDIGRYGEINNKHYIIFPYLIKNGKAVTMTENYIQKNFKNGYNYLKQNESLLRNREKASFNNDNWFLFGRNQGISFVEIEKIISPEISLKGRMTFDEYGEFYHGTTIYSFVKKESILGEYKYYICILNSNLLWFFVKNTGTILRGGYFRYKTKYLEPFPIPELPSNENEFIDKAKIMLSLNSELSNLCKKFILLIQSEFTLPKITKKLEKWYILDSSDFIKELNTAKIKISLSKKSEWMEYFNEQKEKALALKAEIDKTDKEIDQMVYKLYDLTEEEIKLVEENQ